MNTDKALKVVIILALNCHIYAQDQFLVSSETLRQHLEDLYSNTRSHEQIVEKRRVRTQTEDFFQELQNKLPDDRKDMIEVTTQDYTTDQFLEGVNIICTIKGTRYGSSEDEISVIGSHYDSQINTPGVDDNGSGMAALLEIARVLADVVADQRCNLLNSIIIVAFDHEEMGLIGSRIYVPYLVSELLQRYNVKNFQGAYILETILNFDDKKEAQIVPDGLEQILPDVYNLIEQNDFRGDFLLNIIRQDDLPLANRITDQWYQLVGGAFNTTEKYRQLNIAVPLSGNPLSWDPPVQELFRDIFRSDHYNFWTHMSNYNENGLRAVFITDTANFRGDMATCYHNSCDDLSKLTDEKMEFLQIASETFLRSLVAMSTGSEDLQCLYSSAAKARTWTWFTVAVSLILLLLHADELS